MTNFDYRRNLDTGNQVAESDRLLHDHFVAIGANEYVGKPKPSIIVGRKGAGKTALRLHFERTAESSKRCISIEPSYSDLEAAFLYIVHKEERTFSIEFIHSLWEIAVLINLARLAFLDNPSERVPAELKEFPGKLAQDIMKNERYGLGRSLEMISLHFSNEKKRESLVRKLKAYIRETTAGSTTEYYVLIDSIDDTLHNALDTTKRNDLFATFFEALWSFFRSFANASRNALSSRVFLHVFVPFDLYNWSMDRHADHLRQYKHLVSWQKEQLEEFITSRLVFNLPGASQKSIEKLDESEKIAAIWLSFFPETISYQAFVEEDSVSYPVRTSDAIIDMTLRRPRDLQEIIRQIHEHTREARKRFPDELIIIESFDQYSSEIRLSVEREYEHIFPKMKEVLTRFSGNFPRIDKNTLSDLIGEVVGHEGDSIFKAVLLLFEACIIGAVKKDSTGKNVVLFYYNYQDFLQLWKANDHFQFHPAFWHSLQLVLPKRRRRIF